MKATESVLSLRSKLICSRKHIESTRAEEKCLPPRTWVLRLISVGVRAQLELGWSPLLRASLRLACAHTVKQIAKSESGRRFCTGIPRWARTTGCCCYLLL